VQGLGFESLTFFGNIGVVHVRGFETWSFGGGSMVV
jgi:hypothetical protein